MAMYVDLHAHSRKHNIFIYGCESRKNSDKRLQEQVFPLMLHKNAADKVTFEIYNIQYCKYCIGLIKSFDDSSFHLKIVNFEYNVVKKELLEW